MSFKLTELGKMELTLAYTIPVLFFIITLTGSFISVKKLSYFLYDQAKSYSNLEHINQIDIKSKKLSKENLNDIFSSLEKIKLNSKSRGKSKMISSIKLSFEKVERLKELQKVRKREVASLIVQDKVSYQIKQLKVN